MPSKATRAFALQAPALILTACAGSGRRDFERQLSWQGATPVPTAQGYVADSADAAQRLRSTWQERGDLIKTRPGFLAADLDPGAAQSSLQIELSRWESVPHYRAAFDDPKAREAARKPPPMRKTHLLVASGGGYVARATNDLWHHWSSTPWQS